MLHAELESSLQAVSEEAVHTREELDKQTALNEKLENDLLHINQRPSHGAAEKSEAIAVSQDGLAGLNLGQKPMVGLLLYFRIWLQFNHND